MANKSKRGRSRERARDEDEEVTDYVPPAFDEAAFAAREVALAKATFYAIAVGLIAGILALTIFMTGADWKLGWLPILAALAFLPQILRVIGFDDDVTAPKSMFGMYFMTFFTALAVWMFFVNYV